MPTFATPYVSLSLGRLRRAVTCCCALVAASLLVQVLVWCMATFTDVRFQTLAGPAEPAAIVQSPTIKSPLQISTQSATEQHAEPVIPADPNRVLSKFDPIMARLSSLAIASGTMAMLILLPLVALGVLVGISSSTPGTEHSLSAFIWSLPLACLTLPIGTFAGLPWTEGALVSYGLMTSQVDLVLGGSGQAWGGPLFYARFALLPLACVAGLAMVGVRFSSGVSAGIVPKESMRLDPVLEREAANIKPGSLHNGRTGNALRHAGLSAVPERKPLAMAGAGASDAATGSEPVRRLI